MIKICKLESGLRFVYQYVQSPISCTGVFLNVGSRDEDNSKEGIAHLIEHMLFKGTQKRSYLDIINHIENVGGDFNAYTSKEETCLYVTLLNDHIDRSFDILSDVLYSSVYHESEIAKEKQIILDEINSYKDSPSELIFDEFEENFFKGNTLAHNILGTEETLLRYTKNDISEFINDNYSTENIIISYVGGVSYEDALALAMKYFVSDLPEHTVSSNRKTIEKQNDFSIVVKRDGFQSHCMIGCSAFGINDKLRLPTVLLNNYLGGSSFNSILNLKLREENGLTYNIESNFTSYSDTGLFSVYFGTDSQKVEKCLDIIKKEFDIVRREGLSGDKLNIAKTQLSGQLALSVDSKTGLMISNAKSLFFFNKIDTIEEIISKINAISQEQIIEIASKILDFDKFSKLQYV